MTRTLRRLTVALSLLIAPTALGVAAFETEARAGAPATPGPVSGALKGKIDPLVEYLRTNKMPTPARTKKVSTDLAAIIDFDAMAKDSLGDEWGKHSTVEQKEFSDLLKQLVEKNYTKRLDEFANYRIDWTEEKTDAKTGETTVKSKATNLKNSREPATLIDYTLRKRGNDWVVVDIIPEGASYVSTYKKEFTKILKKPAPDGGWTVMINKMKKKLAE
jgi:phospholipid transport system substrate-binding protein